ncbi:R-spondin-4 isoform X2 [Nerophis ophidion]|uniref:R-spondin-4 isoform X2 n=1 Tax=Nerophis ophidion TaxID=159077 RepID=UPI002ADF69E3|nr:R-spondin-4 isoform X2 [Nerophis ophidion]
MTASVQRRVGRLPVAQMRLSLIPMVFSLLCDVIRTERSGVQRPAAHQGRSQGCRNCQECSHDNGCTRCKEHLFLFLQRDGMSHHGTCLHACPVGHFGQRGRDINRCLKCRSMDCEQCFSRDFCIKCKPGFQLCKGRCLNRFPEVTSAQHNHCLGEEHPAESEPWAKNEDCNLDPLAEWSRWSICLRDGAPCGFRSGQQMRIRGSARPGPSPCPSQSQTRKCRMKKRCPTERRRTKAIGFGRKQERKRVWMLANSSTDSKLDRSVRKDA